MGTEPAETTAPTGYSDPAPATTTTSAPAPSYAATPEPAPAVEEAEAEEESPWSWMVFGSAYYQFASGLKARDADGQALPRTGYAFADHHGFGLTFFGGDIAYATEHVGVTMSLRWGPGAAGLIGLQADDQAFILPNLAQGFVSWTPSDTFTLDIGQFGTIYGAEVAEEWQNLNYTRGALYFNLQPFYHTGLRASYAPSDTFGLNFLVANGGPGDRLDVNEVPGVGAQAALNLSESFFLALGYFTQTSGSGNNEDWDQFIDVVATLEAGIFSLVFNADFNYFMAAEDFNLGASVAGALAFSDLFGLALRGEFLYGNLGFGADDDYIITGTLSGRIYPAENLVFTIEPRIDVASDPVYPNTDGMADEVSFALTLGATAHFDG